MILIPLACLIVCVAVMTGKQNLTRTAAKIALIGIIIFGIVPASVKLSDMVYQTQASKVNDAIDDYNNLEIEGDGESGLFNEFNTITNETIENVSSFMDNLLESLAIVCDSASCLFLPGVAGKGCLFCQYFGARHDLVGSLDQETSVTKRPLG